MTREEIFSERFRAFQLRSALGGAKDFQTRGAECINNANHQRCFWTDDGEIDFLALRKIQQRRNIGYTDSHILQSGLQCRTGVTRCDKNGVHPRRLRCFPCQSVLAPAVTND
ncbi:hypothetical protein D3C85_1555860 [compost metagenome]